MWSTYELGFSTDDVLTPYSSRAEVGGCKRAKIIEEKYHILIEMQRIGTYSCIFEASISETRIWDKRKVQGIGAWICKTATRSGCIDKYKV